MIEVNQHNAAEVAARVKAGDLPGPAKSLAEAMTRVMEQVGYVQKTGQMQGHARYSYARESDFIAAIRPEMVRQGITFVPTDMEVLTSEAFDLKSGSRANRIVLRVTFTLTHAPSGDAAQVKALGEGIDSGDKACNKAMTAAMKYALRQSFVIETGDDPDDTPSRDQERAAPVPQPAPKSGTNLAAVPDNPGRRAAWAQKLALCQTAPDFERLAKSIGEDKLLSDADRKALRPVAVETRKRIDVLAATA